jgi:two-component system, NarL family, response regulator NreC
LKTRILIADDHGIVREGLRLKLQQKPEYEVIGEAVDGREAVRLAKDLNPDVVIMDIGMPNLNGIQATALILKQNPRIAVIILSMYGDETYLSRILSAGAKGYLLKDSAHEELHRALQAVLQGKPFFSPAISKVMLEDYMRRLQQRGLQDSYDLLTDREKEILQLLAKARPIKKFQPSLM